MEFVEVNQDEMPGDTWDSFESSDFFDNLDTTQAHTGSAATSTTKTMLKKGMFNKIKKNILYKNHLDHMKLKKKSRFHFRGF